jgi:hypothetical protein
LPGIFDGSRPVVYHWIPLDPAQSGSVVAACFAAYVNVTATFARPAALLIVLGDPTVSPMI